MRLRFVLSAVLILTAPVAAFAQTPELKETLKLKETPDLANQVKAGKLPPIAGRLPEIPRIYKPDGKRYTPRRWGSFIR